MRNPYAAAKAIGTAAVGVRACGAGHRGGRCREEFGLMGEDFAGRGKDAVEARHITSGDDTPLKFAEVYVWTTEKCGRPHVWTPQQTHMHCPSWSGPERNRREKPPLAQRAPETARHDRKTMKRSTQRRRRQPRPLSRWLTKKPPPWLCSATPLYRQHSCWLPQTGLGSQGGTKSPSPSTAWLSRNVKKRSQLQLSCLLDEVECC